MSTITAPIAGKRGYDLEVLLSPQDADLAACSISLAGAGYARTYRGDGRHAYLHRLVLERSLGRPIEPGMECDHINGDKLDNRRENLREVTHRQNHRNRPPDRSCTSRFKGVSLHPRSGRWRARINPRGREVHLGYFDTELEAAAAYDRAARELYGEYAWLNMPDEQEVAAR